MSMILNYHGWLRLSGAITLLGLPFLIYLISGLIVVLLPLTGRLFSLGFDED